MEDEDGDGIPISEIKWSLEDPGNGMPFIPEYQVQIQADAARETIAELTECLAEKEVEIKQLKNKYQPKERPKSCPMCKKVWNPDVEDLLAPGGDTDE